MIDLSIRFLLKLILPVKWLVLVALTLTSTTLLSQSSLESRIDFSVKNMAVEDALLQLSEVANIGILFSADLFSDAQKITINAKNEVVEKVLKQCLAETKIIFKLESGNLILYPRPPRKLTLSGFVEDAKSGERLIAATVVDLNSGKGTTTNEYGFFSLQILEGNSQIQTSYVGYNTDNQLVSLNRNKQIIFKLQPALTLSEIVVSPKETAKNSQQFLLDKGLQVTTKDLESVPTLAGEADLFRYLQLQTGVQGGADGLGGLHVRGGATDQNLVLMDGIPIYNPSHTLGLFSIFNSPTIKTAKLVKDGFSARYGGRLSSIIDVRMKEGNNQNFAGSFGISTLATNLLLEGPIVKNKIGFLLSARRSHIDPLVVHLSKKEKRKEGEEFDGQTNYHFYDINAKLHFHLSKSDRLFLSFYKGADRFEDDNSFFFEEIDNYYYQGEIIELFDDQWGQKLDWGNQIGAIRWNHLFGEKLFANATFTFSEFAYISQNFYSLYDEFYGVVQTDEEYYTRFQSVMQDGGIKLDFDYFPNNKHHLTFGGGFLLRNFKPGQIQITDNSFVNTDNFDGISEFFDETFAPLSSSAKEYELYAEDKFLLHPKLAIQAGIHAAFFQTADEIFPSIQPRLNVLWTPANRWQLSFSGSRMTQFMHILTSSGNGFPNDMWIPSSSVAKPENAWQISAEASFNVDENWTTKLGSYYKKMNNLITYRDAATLPNLLENDPFFWEEDITTGDGTSYGIEYELTKKQGKTTGVFAYNWVKTFRQFAGLNNNRQFPFRNHHEHHFVLHLNHQFNDFFSANSIFEYGSGQQITLVETAEDFAPIDNITSIPNALSAYNAFKLPAYHRLDLNVQANFGKKDFKHQITLGVYNLYNRQNPYFIYELNDEFFPQNNGRKQNSALPILPTIGYRMKWR
jgi:outer membrane receptor for ferrienterochelin and colicin